MNNLQKYIKGDKGIWALILMLAIASLLLVYSSIVTLAYRFQEGNTIYYLLRHGIFLVMGIGIVYVVHQVKYTYFRRAAQLMVYVSIPLLLLTLLVGENINNANRWLTIPIINQSFQTSDLAKLALIMFVARFLSVKQGEITDFKKTFLPIMIPILIVCGLIFPANFSTAAVLFTACLILMFIGRVPVKFIASLIGAGIIMGALAFTLAKTAPGLLPRSETWSSRIETFLPDAMIFWEVGDKDMGEQRRRGNYQSEQAKIAIATGGITGKGPGNSTQRNFLPHPYSDFIYAIVLEEYGLVGGLAILMFYLILLYRSIRVAGKAPKTFGPLLVIGISFTLVFQALINMAVAVNLFPVTGQPLPLVSMGGTSIWFTCIALGIILSVSRSSEEEEVTNKTGNKTANHAIA